MPEEKNWPRIAVVGAGAVGGYFGGMLANAGAHVTMIGRKHFVDAVRRDGLFHDSLHFRKHVPVHASTEMSAAHGAELVLFCVKTVDTVTAAKSLSPFLASDATFLCLQNGVENAEQVRSATGIEALAAVVYVAASVPQPGQIKHVGRGDLVLPESPGTRAIAEMFERASIPCRLTDNIDGELWAKLLWNCALNAISALGQARYGEIAASADARRIMQAVVNEFWNVSQRGGVVLPNIASPTDGMAGVMQIANQMSEARSSTAQDIQRGRRTEIDALNGYIARRADELGINAPVNHSLFTLVKLLEAHSANSSRK
ncbi:MAG: 2-dehydropantoate 2-reductase [Acidobacteria bacterium]|jgi:2-dehydropantoate 2-reductase|nr:MAG: 2-dehydropantoate 2-reductase [Acidobacteriota bacterium]